MSQFDRERLDALVADGWLRSQRHPHADLWIYNYTEKTQYESHWTPETLVCRGLILDQVGNVVARPFSKFFNYGSPQAANLESWTIRHHVEQALRAHVLYQLDKDYVVKDGEDEQGRKIQEVVIVDEFTGRLMPGRRWSDGLHQAVEAKENVKIQRENQTLATITFQNYFRMY